MIVDTQKDKLLVFLQQNIIRKLLEELHKRALPLIYKEII